MHKKIKFGYLGISLLFIWHKALAVDPVGTVIAVRGQVYAIAKSGEKRELQRKNVFYLHEIIETKDASTVQLRLKDNTFLSLRSNTKYTVDEFKFDATNPKESSYVGKLTEGVLISLSSTGQDATFNNHQLKTPIASISIRGTLYEAGIGHKKYKSGEIIGTGWVYAHSGKVSVTSSDQNKISRVGACGMLDGGNSNNNACICSAKGILNQQNEFVPTSETRMKQISAQEIRRLVGKNIDTFALEVAAQAKATSNIPTSTTAGSAIQTEPVPSAEKTMSNNFLITCKN